MKIKYYVPLVLSLLFHIHGSSQSFETSISVSKIKGAKKMDWKEFSMKIKAKILEEDTVFKRTYIEKENMLIWYQLRTSGNSEITTLEKYQKAMVETFYLLPTPTRILDTSFTIKINTLKYVCTKYINNNKCYILYRSDYIKNNQYIAGNIEYDCTMKKEAWEFLYDVLNHIQIGYK